MKEDVKLFTNTEPANFCDGVVGCSSFDNLPFDVVGDAAPNETPDIGTECGPLMILIPSVDVRIVLVEPGLHGVVGTTSIGFPVVSVLPGDSCLVHQVVHYAAFAREYLAGIRCLIR